jgi:Ni/Co efflux regulator RcnB
MFKKCLLAAAIAMSVAVVPMIAVAADLPTTYHHHHWHHHHWHHHHHHHHWHHHHHHHWHHHMHHVEKKM